jgi:DNA-binding transcriptional LysR family regulator
MAGGGGVGKMDNWDEIRTAFQVARLGTVSGAAELLGVHHATVIRHIDALERRLGVRLFQRHARGYAPTEAGRDLLATAQVTEEQFAQLAARIKGQGEVVTGEMIVTSISGIADLLIPVLATFQAAHDGVVIRYLSDLRVFRLDHGEAHVAIRAGAMPQEPDYVVQPFVRLRWGLYAAPSYVARHGLPAGPEDFGAHRFVGPHNPESRAPFNRWLRAQVPGPAQTFLVNEPEALEAAIRAGAGIGFVAPRRAGGDLPLVEVMAPQPEWDSPLWIVTHVDLHRTRKVQAFLVHLKACAQGWEGV